MIQNKTKSQQQHSRNIYNLGTTGILYILHMHILPKLMKINENKGKGCHSGRLRHGCKTVYGKYAVKELLKCDWFR